MELVNVVITVVVFVFVFAHGLLLGGLFLFPLLPGQLDLDPVHPPYVSDLALRGLQQLKPLVVELLVVTFDAPHGKCLTMLLPYDVTLKALLDHDGRSVHSQVEIADSLLHAISEFAEGVLELEDASQHVPVTA